MFYFKYCSENTHHYIVTEKSKTNMNIGPAVIKGFISYTIEDSFYLIFLNGDHNPDDG